MSNQTYLVGEQGGWIEFEKEIDSEVSLRINFDAAKKEAWIHIRRTDASGEVQDLLADGLRRSIQIDWDEALRLLGTDGFREIVTNKHFTERFPGWSPAAKTPGQAESSQEMGPVTIELPSHCPSWDTKVYGPEPDLCRLTLCEDDIKRIFEINDVESKNRNISRIETHISGDPLFFCSGRPAPASLDDCPCFVDADMRVQSTDKGAMVHVIGISEGLHAPDYHFSDGFDIPLIYRDNPKGALAYLAERYGVREQAETAAGQQKYKVALRMENGVAFTWDGLADDSKHAEGLAIAEAIRLTREQVFEVSSVSLAEMESEEQNADSKPVQTMKG